MAFFMGAKFMYGGTVSTGGGTSGLRGSFERAKPLGTVSAAIMGEIAQKLEAKQVVDDEQEYERQLDLQPSHLKVRRRGHNHRDSQRYGGYRADAHEHEQAAFHDSEPLHADPVRGIRVINEQPR
jgi:hypothetical protein